jgi:hypothetical protein
VSPPVRVHKYYLCCKCHPLWGRGVGLSVLEQKCSTCSWHQSSVSAGTLVCCTSFWNLGLFRAAEVSVCPRHRGVNAALVAEPRPRLCWGALRYFQGFSTVRCWREWIYLVSLWIQNCRSSLPDGNIITGKVGTNFVLQRSVLSVSYEGKRQSWPCQRNEIV